MKFLLYLMTLILLLGCDSEKSKLLQSGEARFRTSFNFGRESAVAELDSLQTAKPEYYQTSDNKFYDLLIRKGIVSNNQLDTSFLGLHVLSFEESHVHFSGIDFNLETDLQAGRQRMYIKTPRAKYKIDLGKTLLGDRWLSANDIDGDGKMEILILEKYYVMNGDNYDLRVYHF